MSESTGRVALVYLAWGPLGADPLREFLTSYRRHSAGVAHELVLLLNGVNAAQRRRLADALVDFEHVTIELPTPVQDLAAYAQAALRLDHDTLCCVNSYSVVLADGWLGELVGALEQPLVGLTGASGSWESQAQWMRGSPRGWFSQLRSVRTLRRDFPRFPNPHLRTTAFAVRRSLLLELGLERARDKYAAYLLESGRESITRAVQRRGLRVVVSGRDGVLYDTPEWALSATYRFGDQRNLLVADRRTRDWEQADAKLRRRLTHDAWGARPERYRSVLSSHQGDFSAVQTRLEDGRGGDYDVAVVIVNYRTPGLVESCLASVAACPQLQLETVIVDNASGDGSVEQLRAALPAATVIAMSENRGFAAGVNAGFEHTKSDFVLVLNPDTEVRAGAVNALLKRLREQPAVGLAAPLLEHEDGKLSPNGYRRFPGLGLLALDLCVPFSYALSLGRANAVHPYAMSPKALLAGRRPAHVTGAAMLVRRAAYEQAGPLDEGFFLYLEETEWQRRLAACGWKIELVPDARVRHLERGGGEAALAHSPHFLASALCYLELQGVPVLLSRVVLGCSLALSTLSLYLIACLPSKRAHALIQARVYGSMARQALLGGGESRS